MAGPGDEVTPDAGGRGRLRAAHADREHAVGLLKAAFVHGRLDKDEFDLRIGQVLTARTYAELTALTADLPAGPAAARPLPGPARGASGGQALRAWAGGAGVFTVVCAVVSVATGGSPVGRLAPVLVFVAFTFMLVAVLMALHAWLERRAARQTARAVRAARPRPILPSGI